MKKMSVIVPVYNAEQYLDRCINSILSQTFSDFELILVDDGSKDKSGEICDNYAAQDNRIKVIHKQNGGVSAARNDGISAARGEYIMFVDSDDYIEEEMLAGMIEKIDDDIDLVICSLRMIGNQVSQKFVLEDAEYSLCELVEKYCLENSFKTSLGGPYCKIFKRSILTENKIAFDTSMNVAEDADFNLKYVINIKKSVVMSDMYYNYVRDNNDSLASKFRSYYYDNVTKIYESTYSVASELGCSEAALFSLTEGHINRLIADLLKAFLTANKKVCIDYMKNIANDKYFIENVEILKKSKIRYITAKLLQKKQYRLLYFFMVIKYKIISSK